MGVCELGRSLALGLKDSNFYDAEFRMKFPSALEHLLKTLGSIE